MTSLLKLVQERIDLNQCLNDEEAEWEARRSYLVTTIIKLSQDIKLLQTGIDPEQMKLGREVVAIRGNILKNYEGAFDAALNEIAKGGRYLVNQYIGCKHYGGFRQREDHEYGYGPRHGSTVFAVELQKDVRQKMLDDADLLLTDEQREAGIAYLTASLTAAVHESETASR
jgi:hypothetical protein